MRSLSAIIKFKLMQKRKNQGQKSKRKNTPTLAVTHQYVVRALDGFYNEIANGSISYCGG